MTVKKTPIGVIPYILSSFLSSKRSPRGGSGPPLPLNPAARRVLSYAPLLGGKRALAPDLPLAQRIQIVRLVLPGEMQSYCGTEVGVQQFSRTTFIIFAQTFLPERTALAVSPVCPILPVHTAGAAVQPLHPKLFPIGALINIVLLIIRKGIPFEFRLGPIGKGLRPDIKRDSSTR